MPKPRNDRLAIIARVNADNSTNYYSHVVVVGRHFQAASRIDVTVSDGTPYSWNKVGSAARDNEFLIQKFKVVAPTALDASAKAAVSDAKSSSTPSKSSAAKTSTPKPFVTEETGQITITVTNTDSTTSIIESDVRYVDPVA